MMPWSLRSRREGNSGAEIQVETGRKAGWDGDRKAGWNGLRHSSVGIACPLDVKLTRTEILLVAFDVPVDLSGFGCQQSLG